MSPSQKRVKYIIQCKRRCSQCYKMAIIFDANDTDKYIRFVVQVYEKKRLRGRDLNPAGPARHDDGSLSRRDAFVVKIGDGSILHLSTDVYEGLASPHLFVAPTDTVNRSAQTLTFAPCRRGGRNRLLFSRQQAE